MTTEPSGKALRSSFPRFALPSVDAAPVESRTTRLAKPWMQPEGRQLQGHAAGLTRTSSC